MEHNLTQIQCPDLRTPFLVRPILLLPSHLRARFPIALFFPGFPTSHLQHSGHELSDRSDDTTVAASQPYCVFARPGTKSSEGPANENGHIYFVGSDVWKRPFPKWIQAIFTSSWELSLAEMFPRSASIIQQHARRHYLARNTHPVQIFPTFTEPQHSSLEGGAGILHCLLMLTTRSATVLPNGAVYNCSWLCLSNSNRH